MSRYVIRVAVAILTFLAGIALFWPFKLIQRVETALVDRFYNVVNDHDVRPISLTFDSATDANEIYRVLIHDQLISRKEIKLIVLWAETTSYKNLVYDSQPEWKHPEAFQKLVKEGMPEAESQTLDNYLLRNRAPEQLKVWDLDVNYALVSRSELPHDDVVKFWSRYYEKFPTSSRLISFSNVGFNNQHDQAFVYVDQVCGGLCGGGGYVLLKKVNGKWEIQNELVLFVA
jgi:hypothetical protein